VFLIKDRKLGGSCAAKSVKEKKKTPKNHLITLYFIGYRDLKKVKLDPVISLKIWGTLYF